MQDAASQSYSSEPTDERLLHDFVSRGDAGAFAAIVRRHGGLVAGVCRRVLGREQDVEDAFQATFLVLLRKAPSLSRPNLLGGWLYGVAYRIAGKLRSANVRRRAREAPIADLPPLEAIDEPSWYTSARHRTGEVAMVDLPAPDASDEVGWRDLQPVFDDELRRLPDRYRMPLVLFYLEGKTAGEVAAALGRSRGTVLSQLARAREKLRIRLSRRKLTLSVGLLMSVLGSAAACHAAVPDRLVDLGMRTLPGDGAGVSGQARMLAGQVLREMFRRKLWTIGTLLFATLLAARVDYLAYVALSAPPVAVCRAGATFDADGFPLFPACRRTGSGLSSSEPEVILASTSGSSATDALPVPFQVTTNKNLGLSANGLPESAVYAADLTVRSVADTGSRSRH
jgi:RNA polymerase sigma factor (sigma-70 family)